MQLVILAAGMGTRLGALTRDIPKCFIEVLGETLLERSLRVVSSATELRRIVLVVGYKKELFRELIGTTYQGIPVCYVDNDIYDQTNNIYSLYLASDYLCDDDTLLIESDLVFEPDVIKRVLQDAGECSVAVDHYRSWMDGTVVRLTRQGRIEAFIRREESSFHEVDTYYKTVNIYKFSKSFSQTLFVPYMGVYITSNGRNEYYESVFRLLVNVRPKAFSPVILSGDRWEDLWYEADDILDLDVAETLFSHDINSLSQRGGGLWRFPRAWDFTARRNAFFPPRDMQEEIAAYLGDYITDEPSSTEVQRLLLSKHLNISKEYIQIYRGEISALLETIEAYASPAPISYYCYADRDLPASCSATILRAGEQPQIMSTHFTLIDESSVDLFPETQSCMDEQVVRSHSGLVLVKDLGAILGIKQEAWFVVVSSCVGVLDAVRSANSERRLSSLTEAYLQIIGRYRKVFRQSISQMQIEAQTFARELGSLPLFARVEACGFYVRCWMDSDQGRRAEDIRLQLYQEAQILLPKVSDSDIYIYISRAQKRTAICLTA